MASMRMVDLVSLLAVGWGVGWVVARSQIGAIVRRPLAVIHDLRIDSGVTTKILTLPIWALAEMAQCAGCIGFWSGVAMGQAHPLVWDGQIGAVVLGFAVAGVNAALDARTGAAHATETAIWDARQSADEANRLAAIERHRRQTETDAAERAP